MFKTFNDQAKKEWVKLDMNDRESVLVWHRKYTPWFTEIQLRELIKGYDNQPKQMSELEKLRIKAL